MAKTITASKKIEPAVKKSARTVSTPVRNSAIPKPLAAGLKKKTEVTSDMIAKLAYEIHTSGSGGSELDNWFAAERQLKAGA